MSSTDSPTEKPRPAASEDTFVKKLISKPYLYIPALFALLLLLSPLAGLIHETLVIDDACTVLDVQPVEELSTSWHYAWEQPKQEMQTDAFRSDKLHWTPTDYPINPPDRNGRSLLFLKHTLPMGDWQEPTLLIDGRGILLTFRAYVDGKQVHSFGKMNDVGKGNISGISSHLIALDEEQLGKDIVFKIFSDYSNIGIRGRTSIGSRSAIYRFVLQRDITRLVTGVLMLLIGMMDFFSYRDNIKATGSIPMFGILSLALGLYTINVTTLKDVIFFAPVFWFNAYIVAMTIIPVGAIGFIWQTFRPQDGNFLHHLWRLHVGYALICQLFFLLALYQLAPLRIGTLMLNGLRWLLIAEFFMIIGIVSWDAFIGKNIQARIYLGGFVPIIVAGIHDSLVGLGKIPSSFSYVPWAMMVFILSLELIRRRKFIKVQNELKRYTVRLEKKSQEKEELLRDLHDGIGGLVTNIKFLSEMGRSSQSLPEMKESLTNISEHASESLIEIGNFMQSIDEDDTDWAILEAKFRQFGKKLLESRGITFHLKTDLADDLNLPDPVTFMNVLQIYKEALTNAAKHSSAKSVQVDLTVKVRNLHLSIQDDGIGFGQDIVHGKGLANMKARAQKIDGTLSITSKPGTVVALELPLKPKHP